ncbi:ATP-binding protein [Variovorax sp. KBS0712]|uniref:HD domain-containing protein n=1 Tax=Variovorax sp. KBS0712 TaxID=2578111 RepID=UPI00111BAA80|nr:ATP-binding protein [Variovorax sp. KBS0712]TSD60292.1 ATP-binding protein [Variovorax sp. KBS0712]
MDRYEQTDLWRTTLAEQGTSDLEERSRERLRNAFRGFRNRAAILGGEIALDLPEFTVHDLTHLDALWELADLIAGQEYAITPAEAFVLGGAFLTHDLGNGLAAYPDGIAALRSSPLWADTIAAGLRKKTGRSPKDCEIESAPQDIQTEAMRQVLRELHAKQAARLALVSWRDRGENSTEYHLIEDPELRRTYGTIIGKIAHSHWWSVDQLREKMPDIIGAPGGFNKAWTVDPIKIACLLRVADASHIDDRRAPGFLAAVRKPSGVSANHWNFQEKLNQPRLISDRLAYSSKESFSIDEVGAWWTCFDALQMIDAELRRADALLSDMHRPRFSARGVVNSDDPARLAMQIATDGWVPIDAKIKVGNVAQLVSNLGGEKLYGRNHLAPLRELIQNGSDAVRARRLLEGREENWGEIVVRVGEDEIGKWIEVEDSGVGMSKAVLVGPFLDFGNSLWGTALMHKELPGLEAKGFSSTGQFGIGFFSIFMWGDKVQVASRRAEAARSDTLVLEFRDGLNSRPVLRNASASETLMDGGTKVRVWFRQPSIYKEILAEPYEERVWTLESRCAWLCPALDVNLFVCAPTRKLVVGASDWINLPGEKLLSRVNGERSLEKKEGEQEIFNSASDALRKIEGEGGEILGRCSISAAPSDRFDLRRSVEGIVVVGGVRATGLTGIAGIMIGSPHTAARNVAIPHAEGEMLVRWTLEQASLALKSSIKKELQIEFASRILAIGGNPGDLSVAECFSGFVNANDIRDLYSQSDEVILVQDASLSLARAHIDDLLLENNVISVGVGYPHTLQLSYEARVNWPEFNESDRVNALSLGSQRSMKGFVIAVLAAAWGFSAEEVIDASLISSDTSRISRFVWSAAGKRYKKSVSVIRRPKGAEA